MTKKNENSKEAEFNQYSTSYSDTINDAVSFAGQGQSFFIKRKADHLLNLLKVSTNSDHDKIKILDVGCGHGLIHSHLISSSSPQIELHAVDMADEVIRIAKKENSTVNYKIHDGKNLPYDDASFDAVYAICVMHHVPPSQWSDFLLELKRVVKNNGVIAIYEHNPFNPVTVKVVNNCPIDEDAVLLSHLKLKKLFNQCSIKNPTCKSILFTPFDNKFFKKLDHFLGWLPLGAQYCIHGRK